MAEKTSMMPEITRRGFVKGVATTTAVAGIFGTGAWLHHSEALAEESPKEEVAYCWHKAHCQGRCSLKCTVRDGRLVLVEPNDTIENKRYKKICLKGIAEIQQVYSDQRIQTPLRRVGERGSNEFEPISWEEAFEDLYQNITAVQQKYGADSVWVNVSGEASEMDVLARMWGCRCSENDGSDIGYGNGMDPATRFMGGGYGWATNGSRDWKNSEFLLICGTNYLETSLTLSLPFFEAKEAGCEIVTVDPHYSTTARKSNEWVAIQPGTDQAMWLGMISYALDNKLYDEEFMKRYTSFPYLVNATTGELVSESAGTDEDGNPLFDYKVWDTATGSAVSYAACEDPALEGTFDVNGEACTTVFSLLRENQKPYTLAWASEQTTIPEAKLEELIGKITTKKTAIAIGHGGNDKIKGGPVAGHSLAVLMALLGNMGRPGVAYGCYQGGREHNDKYTLGSWKYPESMVEADNDLKLFDLPDMGVDKSNVHAMFFVGSGLVQCTKNYVTASEWAKSLDYIVVNDIYFSDTTPWADLILPSCTPFENSESLGRITAHYGCVRLRQKVIDPLFDSRTNFDIIKGIAEKWGYADAVPQSNEELARYSLATSKNPDIAAMTLEDIVSHGCVAEIPDTDYPKQRTVEEILQTPTGRSEIYYENYLESGQQLPNWDEPSEIGADNALRAKYPLAFNENTSRYQIHDSFRTASWIWPFAHAFVEMNPADLEARDIDHGDHVRVFNDRGSFGCVAHANNAVRPGMVRAYQSEHARYLDFGSFSDVLNDAVDERLRDSLKGPSILHSDALVQVEKA